MLKLQWHIHEQFAFRDEELGSGERAEALIGRNEKQNAKPATMNVQIQFNLTS